MTSMPRQHPSPGGIVSAQTSALKEAETRFATATSDLARCPGWVILYRSSRFVCRLMSGSHQSGIRRKGRRTEGALRPTPRVVIQVLESEGSNHALPTDRS